MLIKLKCVGGAAGVIIALALSVPAQSHTSAPATIVKTAALNSEVTDFLGAELSAHLADIKSLNPPPDKVVGAGTTGEYTWGTFMRALGAYAELSGSHTLAGRDLAREIGQIGLLEYRLGGTRFSQLYAVLALRHFGLGIKPAVSPGRSTPVGWPRPRRCAHF